MGAKERLLLLFFSLGVCLFVSVSSCGLEISGKIFFCYFCFSLSVSLCLSLDVCVFVFGKILRA